jgi:hypothetical protein
MKILSEELIIINENAKDDLLGYFQVEIYGLLKHLKAHFAVAHFGTFERTGHRTVLYSATVWTERDGQVAHCYDSEFSDDLRALLRGNVYHLH